MIDLSPERIADAAGLEILREGPQGRPERAVVDSRDVAAGDLFFGLPGARADGGEFAPSAIAEGAWGVVARPQHARAAAREDRVQERSDRSEHVGQRAPAEPLVLGLQVLRCLTSGPDPGASLHSRRHGVDV